MTNAGNAGWGGWGVVGLFAAVAVLVSIDLAGDWQAGVSVSHALAEGGALAVSLGGIVLLLARLRRLGAERRVLGRDLQRARAEAERWRAEAKDLLRGLGEAVSEQFARWELTPAEQEVGLLLLKGLSHKEIAQVRDTTERTARQQALGLYRKAGLAGRAELAAFFFEDLLLPQSGPPAGAAGPGPRRR